VDKLHDKVKEKDREASERRPVLSRIKELLGGAVEGTSREGRAALTYNILIFTAALLFTRCHVVFSAHPLGIALLAVLPVGVWSAMLGAVVGALSLGGGGIIYALISIVTVFLRVVISGGKGADGTLFGESLALRISTATVCGFIGAIYEVMLAGFTRAAILYGLATVIIPPVAVFALSGLFSSGISLTDAMYGAKSAFSLAKKSERERYNIIFFQLSALAASFLISLSLVEFELFGISAAYVFVSFVTLVVSKRFGPLRALAVGFVSSIGISSVYSVSYGLAGLGAGLLAPLGVTYSLIGGGVLMSVWSGYSSGLVGFLTTLPEYLIGAALATPIIKGLSAERAEVESVEITKNAKDMVGTMALSYQNKYVGSLDSLEASLTGLAAIVRGYSTAKAPLTVEEYRDIVIDVADRHCKSCSSLKLCMAEDVRPCIRSAESIAEKLRAGGRISGEDVNTATEFCALADTVAEAINHEAARAERTRHRAKDGDLTADEYELISRLINEARDRDARERATDTQTSERLTEVIEKCGLGDGVIRSFGERHKHFILAGEDEAGDVITSRELHNKLESVAGVKLATPEYYRHGKMALMECGIRRGYATECAVAKVSGEGGEISGDTLASFESSDDYFYSLISDGMGRGEIAEETSRFVVDFLTRLLDFSASKETVLHLLNNVMRHRSEECSATVDLFELDLLTGEGTFIKSGAAPSFVKRDESIFRIKSQTAPIGLLRTIDTEKIRVEVRGDDYVIMLSDGVADSAEDAPWLLELLAKPPKRNVKEYADLILSEAVKHSRSRDDMSVAVIKVMKV
jgi:stage II sporulation protein E